MKKKIIIIIALFVLTAFNTEEKFKVNGKVFDNNESLVGVKVLLNERVFYTDLDGNFTIDNLKRGEHKISFSLISYNTKEVTFNPAKENILNIKLKTK